MKWLIIALSACALLAEPVLKIEIRNGLQRAVVQRVETGESVTDEQPARAGERLAVEIREAEAGGSLWVGDREVETQSGGGRLLFSMPPGVKGSFVELSLRRNEGVNEIATIPVEAAPDGVQLDANEVSGLVARAAQSLDAQSMAVAVVDRGGRALAIYRKPAATADAIETALSLARTGAFFSNNQAPLSSRTVRTISREHFPDNFPGLPMLNTPAAALFGIENTNRGCRLSDDYDPGKLIPRSLNSAGTGPGIGITTIPGGIPLFRNNEVIGGIGVAGVEPNAAEFAVVAAAFGTEFFIRLPLPPPGAVFIDGIRLPYVDQTTRPPGTSADSTPIAPDNFVIAPRTGAPVADEYLVAPRAGSALSADEVRRIIENSVNRANRTRAQIRLPLGSRTRMVISVADLDGRILALYRMPDSTIFSIDVAASKARNVIYFSGNNVDSRDLPDVPSGTAVTNRTLGFGAQSFFPSGIANSPPGPFRDLFLRDLANPCTQGHQAANANQSGIVFFPGSAPLYKNRQLAGGLGVSGDGVEQDDYVTAGGAAGFEPPDNIRADQIFIRGVRLPYFKFPRNPEQ
jgi:uncharacterized protein GlcG (DUF336 family)